MSALLLLFLSSEVSAQCYMWVYPVDNGGGAYTFNATPDSGSVNPIYNWTFDDGGTASGVIVQHTFTTSGMHSYCLNFTGNCTTTFCDSFNVNVCSWPAYVTQTGGDTIVSFSVQGAQAGWTYNWSFPDGVPSTSTSPNPSIAFPSVGSFPGTLTVNDPGGCVVNFNANVDVYDEQHSGTCTPWSQAYIGAFGLVTFYALADSANPISYVWDFGDGTGSTQNNPQHTYATSGSYTYCANFTGANCSGSICKSMYVNVCDAAAYINYTVADSTATFTLDGMPTGSTYNWSFPDGDITTSTSAVPSVVFPGVGAYSVSVTATAPNGCVINRNTTATITNGNCAAQLHIESIWADSVAFYVTPDSGSTANLTYSWTFGDGATGSGQYVSHTYAASGDYVFCVTTSGSLCSNTFCDTVHVDVCAFEPEIVVYNVSGTDATFVLYGVNPGGIYQWSFPDGTPQTSSAAMPTISFPANGSYTVYASYINGAGCTKSDTLLANIVNNPCNAYFNVTDLGQGAVIFGGYIDSMQLPMTYTWDFGDGSTGTGKYCNHTFTTSGNYNVCLTYSGNGCSGTVCNLVYIDACNLGGAYYSLNGATATYYAQGDSTQSWTYHWSFPGGLPSSSTSSVPVVTYAAAGTYNAYAIVSTPNGCSDTLYSSILIPNVGFNGCDTTFYSSVNGYTVNVWPQDTLSTASTFTWNFGDGSTGAGMYTSHTYATSGWYQITMNVSSTNCSASVYHSVYVSGGGSYFITGDVLKSNVSSSICEGQIYLISDSAGYLTAIDTFEITDDTSQCHGGYYWFAGLPAGTYYLKAALGPNDVDYANYLPTYSYQELNWATALPIVLGPNSAQGTSIELAAGNNPGGPGFVGGWVSQGAGMALGTDHHERGVGDPIAGAQINLLNAADMPVAYTYSDASGNFAFNNLALGTYRVYAEWLNKVPLALTVTLTQNNPSINNVQVEISSDSAVSTGIKDENAFYVDGIMPNPTKDKATVTVNVERAAEATVSISDVSGRIMQTRIITLSQGSNLVSVDLTEQAAGVYYMSINGKYDKRTLKLVKTQ